MEDREERDMPIVPPMKDEPKEEREEQKEDPFDRTWPPRTIETKNAD